MAKINEELARIQKELKAPKDQFNGFGKYKYRNCEGILEAVKPLLNGLVLTLNDELVIVGNRYYIKATAALSNGENTVSAVAYAREPENKKGMDESQITGACSSYARKYALSGLFCIDDGHDADNMDNRDHKQKSKSEETATKKSPDVMANNLSPDQVSEFVMPFGKYKELTLTEISRQETESGVAKGIEWLEWFCEQETKKDDLVYAQKVVTRFLEENLKGVI